MPRIIALLILTFVFTGFVGAADKDSDLKQLQGKWEVVELVEDGKTIPREAIQEWLPSGGHFEIADNAIMYTSPQDDKKHVKLFSLDATQFPKGIDIVTREKKEAAGIYQVEGDKVILCFADPDEAKRPTEFSAREGSNQLLMTLARAAKQSAASPTPPKQDAPKAVAKVLTDAEIREKLKGVWRYNDAQGALIVTFSNDGTFSTIREKSEIRVFQKVFVQTPISSGTWRLETGAITFHILTSAHPDRVNKKFDFVVRSISDRDFIFTDFIGSVGKATRIR